MTFTQRLFDGINTASASFSMTWQHKRLVLYTMVPVISSTTAQFIVYNFFAQSWAQKLEALFNSEILVTQLLARPTLANYLLAFGINFISISLVTFFYAALTWHTLRLLQGATVNIQATLHHCMTRFQPLLTWSIISSVVTLIVQIPTMFGTSLRIIWEGQAEHTYTFMIPFALIIGCLSLLWSLFTLLVIPIITIEHGTVWSALRLSARIVSNTLAEVVGGVFWIFLIGFIIGALLTLPTLFLIPSTENTKVMLSLILAIPPILFGMFFSAALGVFRTKIFYQFYEQPREEMYQIEHPPF